LNDTTKNWAVNQWQGRLVRITDGTGRGQARTVASNTATRLTLSAGETWTTVPDDTSTYVINEFSPSGASALPGMQLDVLAGTLETLTSTGGQPFAVLSYGFDDFDSYGHMGGTLVNSVGPAIRVESPAEGSILPAGQTVLVTGRAT